MNNYHYGKCKGKEQKSKGKLEYFNASRGLCMSIFILIFPVFPNFY